ncbi:hypothetical protein EV363DRAFT_1193747 [Boletus edulis]|uniref:Uncharacterized protein n=1 Tax=Boletus edulis BED1 TaxID=1328754 RepID=A0AAD4C570_BOLED|nr:hypothetical protein EV363DRAFT_1193747 [Boletus edulis]KAF8449271.1 hypothetical protein L210DRAFT_2654638 [Boletus edulis BED1]
MARTCSHTTLDLGIAHLAWRSIEVDGAQRSDTAVNGSQRHHEGGVNQEGHISRPQWMRFKSTLVLRWSGCPLRGWARRVGNC